MTTVIHQYVEQCRQGINPRLIARLNSGWLTLGEQQFLRGYCVIYPDPVVEHLNTLPSEQRKTLLFEATVVGDALLYVTDAVRINYEILGNLAPALHVHIFPRYENEDTKLKTSPVWFYDWDSAGAFDREKNKHIMRAILGFVKAAGIVTD